VRLELFLESIRSIVTKRVYSTYLSKYSEKYNLKETDPRKIEGMIIEYCPNHSSLTGNVFMPVPEYATCDDVNLEKLNRGMDSLLTKLENMTQEELQEKFGTDDK
jgi:hypothetical protein